MGLAFRLALQDPDVRWVPSLAICLFVSARSLVRCAGVEMLLRKVMFDEVC